MFGEKEEQEFAGLLDLFKQDKELGEMISKVSFEDLFSYKFMAENSDFSSLDDMLYRSGFGIVNPLEIENVSPERWDEYIAKHTKCQKWHEFGKLAMIVWMNGKLAERQEKQ